MTRAEQKIKAANEMTCNASNKAYFISGATWADSHPHWIPVEVELPKADGRYIIADKYGGVEQMNFDAESEYWWLRGTGKMSDFVTHWMPMPEAPRKED